MFDVSAITGNQGFILDVSTQKKKKNLTICVVDSMKCYTLVDWTKLLFTCNLQFPPDYSAASFKATPSLNADLLMPRGHCSVQN